MEIHLGVHESLSTLKLWCNLTGVGCRGLGMRFELSCQWQRLDYTHLSQNSPLFAIHPSRSGVVLRWHTALGQREDGLHGNPNHVPGHPGPLLRLWSHTAALVCSLADPWFARALKTEPSHYITLPPPGAGDILVGAS